MLRMEDLDHPKVKIGADRAVLEDLRWLGLDWDEGPDVGGPYAPYVQTQRLAQYAAALARLQAQAHVYPCICARRDVEAGQSAPHAGEDGLRYDGVCRNRFASYAEAQAGLAAGRLPAWRFGVAQGTESIFMDDFAGQQRQWVDKMIGDFVIARHPTGAGYMLAVVVDDVAMRITEVVRGDDLLPATHRQLLLYQALNLPPPVFRHVPLVVSSDGRRLAKRHGDTRLAVLRREGITPERVIGLLAWWCGWAAWGEELTVRDLLPRYDLNRLPHTPAVLTEEVKRRFNIK